MLVSLPDNVPALERLSEGEIKCALAAALYAARKLTLVQAADVAGTTLFEFQALLRDSRIPQHYDEADLEQDLIALRELPPPVIVVSDISVVLRARAGSRFLDRSRTASPRAPSGWGIKVLL